VLSFTLECQRTQFPAVLALLGEILREPNFPANEFDVLKRQSRAELSKAANEPALLASRALQRTLNPYPADDVRYIPTLEEAIERLDRVSLDDVRQLYTQVGASVGEVVVVGDVDPETTPSLLASFLKDWKSDTPYRRIAPTAQTDVAGQQIVLQTPDKANAVFMAAESLVLEDTDPDYAALLLGNYLFGGAPLASRLSMRIRGKEGLSYAVGSQFSADALDRVGRFAVFAITNPKNIDKVNQAVAEELKKMSAHGVSSGELDEGRKAYLQQLKVLRSTDSQLADLLLSELHFGRTFAYYADLEEKIGALTAARVNEAFRKWIVAGRLVIVEAGDFAKK
jgi:zinc protease